MNRKTLVLPAVVGLLAPVLAACGGSDGGSGERRRHRRRHHGPVHRLQGRPGAPRPGLRLRRRHLEHPAPDRPDPDDPARAAAASPVPEAAEKCGFTDTGNERYRCTLRSGLKFSDGDADHRGGREVLHRARAATSRPTAVSSALLSTIDTVETQGDREVDLPPQDRRTRPSRTSCPPRSPASSTRTTTTRTSCARASRSTAPARTPSKAEVKDDELVQAVFTKNPTTRATLKVNNDKVELRSFADADAMGKALEKGDIDLMTRTMSPEQIQKLADSHRRRHRARRDRPAWRSATWPSTPSPGREEQGRPPGHGADHRPRRTRRARCTAHQAEPLYSLVPAEHHRPHQLLLQQVRRARASPRPRALLQRRRHHHPGEADPALHDRPLRSGHRARSSRQLKKQLNDSGLFDVDIKGDHVEQVPPGRAASGEYDVYGMGWFPDFPDAGQLHRPVPRQGQLPQLAVRQHRRSSNNLIPAVPPRGRPRSPRPTAFTQIQDIVADDVPMLPLWQGKQYVAARDDITGVGVGAQLLLHPPALGAGPRPALTRRAHRAMPTAAGAGRATGGSASHRRVLGALRAHCAPGRTRPLSYA